MAHFLGIGMTHYPLLAVTDEHMAGLLRWTLQDPDIPAAEKDPASWPAPMRTDWDGDGGTAAAARHRKVLRDNLTRCREALDEFRPDLVVVWGDDQYENFREEVVPPFCVLAYGDLEGARLRGDERARLRRGDAAPGPRRPAHRPARRPRPAALIPPGRPPAPRGSRPALRRHSVSGTEISVRSSTSRTALA